MRSAHTVEQVRAAEDVLLARLPSGALMARAATGLAVSISDYLGGAYGRRVLLLVGSGNNGGDALYAGAWLARRGARVEALLLSDSAHEAGLAALRAAGGRATRESTDLRETYDVLVDGIAGIGSTPGLRPGAVAALTAYEGVPIVAVDVPSGVGVDTGELPDSHVNADLTVTFGTHKAAHLVDPASLACGALVLVDIGLDLPPAPVEALTLTDAAALLPRPEPSSHKYTRGVVGIRAGSATYPGAALLCVAGANTGLVGMVRHVAGPSGGEALSHAVHTRHPEVVGDGRVQAWVVGPGGGEDAAWMLDQALASAVPVVIDADALGAMGPATRPGPDAVLTPHAGELAQLMDTDRSLVEASPLRHAREAAAHFGCTVLLKGHHTLIAAPDGRVRVTTTGTGWLATAGAGDVLAGLIGALMAAGLEPYDAASVGSWVHGAAARRAGGGGPIVASDLGHSITGLLRELVCGAGQSTP